MTPFAQRLQLSTHICPRYWGRLWRYRWIVRFGVEGVPGGSHIIDGYAWTRSGAEKSAAVMSESIRDLVRSR